MNNQKYPYNPFSINLSFVLQRRFCTREDIADRLGVSVKTVRQWEDGTKVPDVCQFREIADCCGLPFAWFLETYDTLPEVWQMAELLGLSADTVERMMTLAKHAPEEALDAVDTAVCALLDAVAAGLLKK